MVTTWRFTVADLAALPEPLDDKRYEPIDGELFVSTQPSSQQQITALEIGARLREWGKPSALLLHSTPPSV